MTPRGLRSISLLDRFNLARTSWGYSAVSPTEHTPQPSAWLVGIKNRLSSRIWWRCVLAATLALLVVDLLRNNSLFSNLVSSRLPTQDISQAPHGTDWTQFAYCQYVTNEEYLCNSLMIFESLHRLDSKASRVMMYPQDWDIEGADRIGRLLRQARDVYRVELSPIHVQHFPGDPTWSDSFTKLLAFNQTQFQRVLSLDSDATILAPLDELFLLPSAPVAMPRAYWLDDELSSQLVLIEPSEFQLQRILRAFENRTANDFDMEIVNNLYGHDCFIIPHRPYNLITGEFRSHEHYKYLGSKEEAWDPQTALDEAKFVHFSDWPLPKPWLSHSQEQEEKVQPDCTAAGALNDIPRNQSCPEREIWLELYADFRSRRKQVCGADFMH
ncbi:glycosyltransferase family 8 protein [Acrodontium crateriforme]|uniref:Glycosyltransferase family 8 protein n=1 Tax=Acrodontium crateriforme TaxID=150365 RepID=A0AAQ3M044_9PEZI|nr:glycosyltransferase family 8 protein [Acrodontium crateriforme]